MNSSISLRVAAAVGAATLSIAALAGCGDSSGTAATPTVGPDGTATLTFADGQAYTVTMAKGQTTPLDVYGNDGGTPISFVSDPATVKVGQPFALQRPENPSTGYTWKVSGTAVGSVVEPVQQFLEPGNDESGEVGVPTQQVWVYRATAPGTGTLVLQEFPPGEDTPSKTNTVKVTVTE